MKLFKVYLIVFIAVGLFVGVSRFFSAQYNVSEKIIIEKNVTQSFAYLSNLRNWEKWSLWNKETDSTLVFFYTPNTQTIGARQYLSSEVLGKGFFEITALSTDSVLAYKMKLREGEMTANGFFTFVALSPNQTEVIWTDTGNVGNNPIKRYMIPLVTKSTSQTFKNGLQRIKKEIEG
jgi:hypothetical protein